MSSQVSSTGWSGVVSIVASGCEVEGAASDESVGCFGSASGCEGGSVDDILRWYDVHAKKSGWGDAFSLCGPLWADSILAYTSVIYLLSLNTNIIASVWTSYNNESSIIIEVANYLDGECVLCSLSGCHCTKGLFPATLPPRRKNKLESFWPMYWSCIIHAARSAAK